MSRLKKWNSDRKCFHSPLDIELGSTEFLMFEEFDSKFNFTFRQLIVYTFSVHDIFIILLSIYSENDRIFVHCEFQLQRICN